MKSNQIFLLLATTSLTILLNAAPSNADDRIAEMCAAAQAAVPEQNERCACALERVAAEVDTADFDLYAEVGAAYFANVAEGQSRAVAWDSAAKSAGKTRGMSLIDVLQITNPVGQLHQDALEDCR